MHSDNLDIKIGIEARATRSVIANIRLDAADHVGGPDDRHLLRPPHPAQPDGSHPVRLSLRIRRSLPAAPSRHVLPFGGRTVKSRSTHFKPRRNIPAESSVMRTPLLACPREAKPASWTKQARTPHLACAAKKHSPRSRATAHSNWRPIVRPRHPPIPNSMSVIA